MADGDLDTLIATAQESDGPRTSIWTITCLRDVAFKSYVDFNSRLLDGNKGKKTDFMIIYHLIQELCFKAMLTDYNKYIQAMEAGAQQSIFDCLLEMRLEANGQELGFDVNPILTKKSFVDHFELYGKLLGLLIALAAIAEEDDRWRGGLPENWLCSIQERRYSSLARSDQERFVRNSITHKNFHKMKDGRYYLEDRNGNGKILSKRHLDWVMKSLATKVLALSAGLSLPTAIQYQVLLAVFKTEVGERIDCKKDEAI